MTMMDDHGGTMGDTAAMVGDDGFCQGMGRVMLPGFQFSFAPTKMAQASNCVMWLFSSWVLDTSTKYGFAIVGTFLLCVALELLRFERERLVKGKSLFPILRQSENELLIDAANTFSYLVQVIIAYAIMLLVMLYEAMIFIAIVLGLATGYFIVLRLKRRNSRQSRNAEDPSVVSKVPSESSDQKKDFTFEASTPCCQHASA